ncbi:30S ribosome-binding factor RbfA [Hydrogenobacter hydrogenophilus]|uniref:Ribosome-binding factor A n=1 Tax=Hydrogenobacter hydrogenophilus TaxID=35835 RepID=A0A285NRS6_9AQUI|nr:30S ribosome-binding factor RbfA [Hydrogenobacter hydrogenophilus]SNZ12212.1 ribosome-binding factor A [Hydrogenobacter hydrogenophilus]
MSRKKDRLSNLLKEEIAYILKHAQDPRLAMVVITRLELSQDLKHAKVYFTTIPEGAEKEVEKALQSARGYIKSQLMKNLRIKFVPDLVFKFDAELKAFEKLWEKL